MNGRSSVLTVRIDDLPLLPKPQAEVSRSLRKKIV